ncbi:MAG TPA: serine protease [Micromonosporaceae bacterium]|nr:serine protease [Micromonosporaceae bacterium]HCU50876.1 serine protease [Micromonosporaceae bacterium]
MRSLFRKLALLVVVVVGLQGSPALAAVRENPTSNLDRIDQEKFPLDQKYEYPDTAGEGVTVYVLSTGILVEHNEFEGRAVHGGSFCTGCGNTDDNGLGTHVASLVGGRTLGVANKTKLVGVKVLNGSGSGSFSEVIAGLTFVRDDHKAHPGQNSVALVGAEGGKDEALNTAVQDLVSAGVHVVVPAANDGDDACNVSPASTPNAITVGATEDTSDNVTDFSNAGECLDIFAPGRNIKAAGITSNDSAQTFSGTVQAAAEVAGAIALIIADTGNLSPAEMATRLIYVSTKGVIPAATLRGSPNVLLRVPPVQAPHLSAARATGKS